MLRLGALLCVIGLAACHLPVTPEDVNEYREALINSRIDDNEDLDMRNERNPKAHVWENSGKFQGDIVLTDEQIEGMVSNYANPNNDGRAAYIVANRRWPGNVLVYEFGANEFNAAQQRAILDSMSWVEHFSCVRFRRRNANERVFVRITGRNTGCYAHVGHHSTMGVHTLNLARSNPGQGCLHNIVIIHELLHNLGFFHMHSAYERYNFVRINWNNIVNGLAYAFYREPRTRASLLNLPYEYESCMHYGTHAFSRNGQPTITATRNIPPANIGHMRYTTHLDWLRLRRHYNCPGAWSSQQEDEVKEEVDRTRLLMEMQLPPPKQKPSFNQDINIEGNINEEDVVQDDIINEDNTLDNVDDIIVKEN